MVGYLWVVIASMSRADVVVRSLVRSLRVALPSVLASVPPVLHCVVAASLESPCNLCPPLAHLGHHLLDQLALFRRNWIVVKCRLEILVVSFSALLR
jgi:hypothetical protein